jgi:hypothetical protein
MVIACSSILTIAFRPDMSMMVPVDAAHGVSEWLLPIARTGAGYLFESRRISWSSATLFGFTYTCGVVTMPPS